MGVLGVGGKGLPPQGIKDSPSSGLPCPPYPPLSGGYKKATPADEGWKKRRCAPAGLRGF